jgi:hypothetical protein
MQRTPYIDRDIRFGIWGFPSKPIYAKVQFETATKVNLGPGETTTVSFVVSPPSGIEPDSIPQYSGFISLKSGRDTYRVPYMGLSYVISDIPILERDRFDGGKQAPAIVDFAPNEIIFYDDDLLSYNMSKNEFPVPLWFTSQPYAAIRLDFVAANTTYVPTYYGFNTSNILDTSTPSSPVRDNFGGVESLNVFFSDSSYWEPWFGVFSYFGGVWGPGWVYYGSQPAGDYRILIRILPLDRDREDEKNWASWLSPVLRLSGTDGFLLV